METIEPTSNQQPRGNRGNRSNRRGTGGRENPRVAVQHQLTQAQYGQVNFLSSQLPTNQVPSLLSTLKNPQEAGDGEEELEDCFICASPIKYTSIFPCNHTTCHICALRMRALYNSNGCVHCRAEAEIIVFTEDDTKTFQDFSDSKDYILDKNLGIKYTKKEIQEEVELLLRYNCPDSTCDVACLGWPHLYHHVKSVHHRVMCNLCTTHKNVFIHEHELFTKDQLRVHERKGDDKPGIANQTGFTGHPYCEICSKYFYGDDELYKHCREKHHSCYVCDRATPGSPIYFPAYEDLEKHFCKEHHPCLEKTCVDTKHIFFASDIDLRAHQIEVHSNNLSRAARRVDLSDFALRETVPPTRSRGGPVRQQANRRVDISSEPVQNQLAKPSVHRPFAGNLTAAHIPTLPSSTNVNETFHQPQPQLQQQQQQPQHQQQAIPPPPSIQDQFRQARAEAIMTRAKTLSKNEETKLFAFNAAMARFKNTSWSASEFVSSLLDLFHTAPADVGKLVHDLADFFTDSPKCDQLIVAWNERKAINENFPSLPVNADSASSSLHGGVRLIKLKNSTSKSNKSAVSQAASWGNRIPWNATVNNNVSTALASAAASAKKQKQKSVVPWAGVSSTPASSSSRPIPNGVSSTNDISAFPSLPPAAKPELPSLGFAVRSQSKVSTNAWAEPKNQDAESENAIGKEDNNDSGGKKKSKKKAQVTLMHWG